MDITAIVCKTTDSTVMWYDNSILMTFFGVIIGGLIGLVGSYIQSRITAKNNIDVVKTQLKNEIEQHRYMEKERLYSELIEFVPQFSYAIDIFENKVNLTREQKIQLNSFKSRLSIFSSKKIYDEFYDLIIFVSQETDAKTVSARIDTFTEMLLNDLKQTTPTQ